MRRATLAACAAIAIGVVASHEARAESGACRAISARDVARVLGVAIGKTKSTDYPTTSNCSYYADPASFPAVIISRANVTADGPPAQQFATITAQSASLFGVKPVRVSGVGDEAASVTKILWVRKGGAIFSINIAGTDASIPGKARAIAAKVRA